MSKELYAQASLHRMVRYDARREILSSVGDLSSIELFGTQLIVAPYVHSGLLMSSSLGVPESEVLSPDALAGLYESGRGFLAQKFSTEDLYQGKVCLVLKIGAEVEASDPRYGDKPLSVGDWIFTLQENTRGVSVYAPGAKQSRVLKALGIEYTGWPSKFVYAADVYGRVADPSMLV